MEKHIFERKKFSRRKLPSFLIIILYIICNIYHRTTYSGSSDTSSASGSGDPTGPANALQPGLAQRTAGGASWGAADATAAAAAVCCYMMYIMYYIFYIRFRNVPLSLSLSLSLSLNICIYKHCLKVVNKSLDTYSYIQMFTLNLIDMNNCF